MNEYTPRQRFIAALDDDLNTPQALAALFDLARDINRARVLRARTVMTRTNDPVEGDAEVPATATLEEVIAKGGGNADLTFRVTSNGRQVGVLTMRSVLAALVSTKETEAAA